jgi:RimJ/RimL family protein N-acetyltransferase
MLQLCKYLFALILIHFSYVEGHTLENEESTIIRNVLKKTNESFSPRFIRFELLKDCPTAISILAQWQYDDWHSYDTSLTLEKLVNHFERQFTENDTSFTIVALKDGMPIGSISLDKEGEPEFSDFSGTGPWMGAFHVISTERNQGIGQELATVALTIAKHLGYQQVNFFTSNFSNVGRYVKKGAQIVESRPFRGHTITIMKFDLTKIRLAPEADFSSSCVALTPSSQ